MQAETAKLRKRSVITTLPDDIIREIEQAYETIHSTSKFGKISIEIHSDQLYKSECAVTKVHPN